MRTALSGPAAGVIAAGYIAQTAGFPDVITGDMGGTSFDVSLIAGGQSMLSPQTSIDFGMVVRTPMIEALAARAIADGKLREERRLRALIVDDLVETLPEGLEDAVLDEDHDPCPVGEVVVECGPGDADLPGDPIPPPLTGNTIDMAFPLDEEDITAPEGGYGPLEVLRYAPEGDVPIAPTINITFNQPMVPLATLAQLAEKDIPVEVSCLGDGRALFRIGPFDRSRPVNVRLVRRETDACAAPRH